MIVSAAATAPLAAGRTVAPFLPPATGVSAPVGDDPSAPGLDAPGEQPRHPAASADFAGPGFVGIKSLDPLENGAAPVASVFINRHGSPPPGIQMMKTAAAITVV